MIDRMQYALIGAVFGAVLAVLLWWVLGVGIGFRYYRRAVMEPNLGVWLKPLVGLGAVAGFVLKDKAGSLIGSVAGAVLHVGLGRDTQVPFWIFIAAVAILLADILLLDSLIWTWLTP